MSETTSGSRTLAHRLAAFGVGLEFDALPPAVVYEVKRRVIDSLGCAMGAWNEEPCTIARRVATRFSAEKGSTVFGTSHRAPPDWAAFANGCCVRYFDYNDTYLSKEPAHPSDNIPAAIAVAEACGASGRDLVTAIALAYEVQCRLCDATSLRAIGWDHVTYGAFSTAVAASRLMRLDAKQTRHAIGIAGVASAALRQSRVGELSHWKGCAFANAARHGVYAAILASEGMTGPAPIFEGEKGFEKLVTRGPIPIAGPFAASGPIDDGFMIVRTSIKCWPAEYHSQSAIEAALKLRPEIKSVDNIESIVIDSHDAAVDIIGSSPEQWKPTTRETADHSLAYITAAALMDGNITSDQFAPARFTEPKLLALVQRVKINRHAELSAMYPGVVGNIVTIKLKDGRTLTRRVNDATGHANNPMSDSAVEAKFHNLADPLLGKDRANKIAECAWRLDRLENVSELTKLLEVNG